MSFGTKYTDSFGFGQGFPSSESAFISSNFSDPNTGPEIINLPNSTFVPFNSSNPFSAPPTTSTTSNTGGKPFTPYQNIQPVNSTMSTTSWSDILVDAALSGIAAGLGEMAFGEGGTLEL